MQRWEHWVVALRGKQYTAALNELGGEGWELVSVVSEAVERRVPKPGGAIPVPRAVGRLEEAADKLSGRGASEAADDPPSSATSRLL